MALLLYYCDFACLLRGEAGRGEACVHVECVGCPLFISDSPPHVCGVVDGVRHAWHGMHGMGGLFTCTRSSVW